MRQADWDRLEVTARGEESVIAIDGYAVIVDLAVRHDYFLLTPEESCCLGCVPLASDPCVEVFMAESIATAIGRLRLTGRLVVSSADPAGWRYQLHDARLQVPDRDSIPASLPPPGKARRRFLGLGAGLGLLGIVDSVPAGEPGDTAGARPEPPVFIDMHSHAGRIIPYRAQRDVALADERPLEALRAPMQQGGLTIVCLAVVADTPITHLENGRIVAQREPAPGELYLWAGMAFGRAHRLIASEGLGLVTDRASLEEASTLHPGAIIAAEGADFLEGDIDRVDEFHARFALRHLQLTHYHVNALGDIQTAPERHGGLTDFGADVIRRCNRLGIVVDVAHGPLSLVRRAVEVTTRPLVLSHTSLAENPPARSRLVSAVHARLIADTGGVIGIWPPTSRFPDLRAMAGGMAAMADVVGVDHVGLGSDMLGLTTASALPSYADLPELVDCLSEVGFQRADIAKLLGGNYLRVFLACQDPDSSRAAS